MQYMSALAANQSVWGFLLRPPLQVRFVAFYCLGVTSPLVSGLEDPSKTSYITPSSVSASHLYQSSPYRVCNFRAPSSIPVNRLPSSSLSMSLRLRHCLKSFTRSSWCSRSSLVSVSVSVSCYVFRLHHLFRRNLDFLSITVYCYLSICFFALDIRCS